jgi:hypothetical protein
MAGKPYALVVFASVLLAFVRLVAVGFPLVSLERSKKRTFTSNPPWRKVGVVLIGGPWPFGRFLQRLDLTLPCQVEA